MQRLTHSNRPRETNRQRLTHINQLVQLTHTTTNPQHLTAQWPTTATDPQRPTYNNWQFKTTNTKRPTHSNRPILTDPQPNHSNRPTATKPQWPIHHNHNDRPETNSQQAIIVTDPRRSTHSDGGLTLKSTCSLQSLSLRYARFKA